MTRAEHLAWCKQRAVEYISPMDAYASFASDMRKHAETANHPALPLGLQLLIGGHLNSGPEMRRFIEGFN